MESAVEIRERRLARWLALLFSAVFMGLGFWSVVTAGYYGRTTKLGGAEVWLSGQPAVRMGMAIMALGLLPLALWFRSKEWAASWAAVSVLLFIVLMLWSRA